MLSKYASQIESFIASTAMERDDAAEPTRAQFTRLLASPTGTRKVPGIPGRMDENGEYICTGSEADIVKDFLKKMYKIDSKESLIESQRKMFGNSVKGFKDGMEEAEKEAPEKPKKKTKNAAEVDTDNEADEE